MNGRVLKLSEDSLQLLKGSNDEAPQQIVSLQEIKSISEVRAAEGAAFAKEAKEGSNPDLKAFAAETYRIVQRHLGGLGAKVQ